jgi:hypothetical protein
MYADALRPFLADGNISPNPLMSREHNFKISIAFQVEYGNKAKEIAPKSDIQ